MSTNKLTEEKKAAMKAKREANPQFAHLASAARRKQVEEFKKDAKAKFSSTYSKDEKNKSPCCSSLSGCKEPKVYPTHYQ